jgi:hypothetical protein
MRRERRRAPCIERDVREVDTRKMRKISRVKKKVLASLSRSSTISLGQKKTDEAIAVTSSANGKT